MATDDKIIKDAQYRKTLGIAFFNATNTAVAMLPIFGSGNTKEQLKENIIELRDWLLEEHAKYYSTVISPIGAIYKAEETIKKLKQCKTKDELRLVWISISADERHDGEIRKVAKELKAGLK